MPDIPFPISSAPGLRPQEGGGRLINAFMEKAPVGAAGDTLIRRSPGLEQKMSVIYPHTRGFLPISISEALWILDERVVKFNQGFVLTGDLGPLSGTEPVTVARNNAVPSDLVAVTDTGCFVLHTSGPPTAYPDGDLPGSPTSVCDFQGFFVWSYGDGKIFASDLNTTAVNAASVNVEQGLFVRRVVKYADRLYAFGDKWTAVYNDAGTQPFPFAREAVIPKGIIGTHAVAGWEPGWANQLIWVGDDFIVYQLNGYTPQPISTDSVSRAIRSAILHGSRNLIEAYVYMYEGNAFWGITARDQWTWEYNLTSGAWNERMSYARADWRGSKTVRMFDSWLAGDATTGALFNISGNVFVEGSDELIWQVESGVVQGFPRGMVIPRSSFLMTAGVGDFDSEVDPKVEISWSLDGGYSYGEPVLRRLGGPGLTKSHPYILNTGLSRGQGVRYKLRVSDPVHVGLFGGIIEPEQRAYSG